MSGDDWEAEVLFTKYSEFLYTMGGDGMMTAESMSKE